MLNLWRVFCCGVICNYVNIYPPYVLKFLICAAQLVHPTLNYYHFWSRERRPSSSNTGWMDGASRKLLDAGRNYFPRL